jgi:hypothetical protein
MQSDPLIAFIGAPWLHVLPLRGTTQEPCLKVGNYLIRALLRDRTPRDIRTSRSGARSWANVSCSLPFRAIFLVKVLFLLGLREFIRMDAFHDPATQEFLKFFGEGKALLALHSTDFDLYGSVGFQYDFDLLDFAHECL